MHDDELNNKSTVVDFHIFLFYFFLRSDWIVDPNYENVKTCPPCLFILYDSFVLLAC
jgi:hypothetical protein